MLARNRLNRSLIAALLGAWLTGASCAIAAEDRVFDVVARFELGGLDPAISGCIFHRMQITEALLCADEMERFSGQQAVELQHP